MQLLQASMTRTSDSKLPLLARSPSLNGRPSQIDHTVNVPIFFHVFGGNLMKRNVLQLVLGLAVMAIVLIGFESQANAFGHGSCGSNGGSGGSHGRLFGGHGSNGSHGGLFHHHGGSCGESS